MKRTIIAISREHGAHGTDIGKRLSARLGIPVYERTVIELAGATSGLSADYLGSLEENSSRGFIFSLSAPGCSPVSMLPQYDVPVSFSAYSAQSAVIRELAAQGSSIIIGRCAEYILRDDPDVVPIFLRADREDRVKYVMDESGLDRKAAEQKLRQIDRGRANYYRSYTGGEWGSANNHDLSINTSVSGVEGAVDIIVALLGAMGRI